MFRDNKNREPVKKEAFWSVVKKKPPTKSIITLEFTTGEVPCIILGSYDGKYYKYLAVQPENSTTKWLFICKDVDENNFKIETIKDKKIYNDAAYHYYKTVNTLTENQDLQLRKEFQID